MKKKKNSIPTLFYDHEATCKGTQLQTGLVPYGKEGISHRVESRITMNKRI